MIFESLTTFINDIEGIIKGFLSLDESIGCV